MSIIDSMSQANQPGGLTTPSKSSRISTAAEFREIMQSVNQTSEAKQAQAEDKAKEQEENTSTAAEEFSRDDEIGERTGKGEAGEIACCPGRSENEQLQPAMGEKQNAHRDAQDGRGEIGICHTGKESGRGGVLNG